MHTVDNTETFIEIAYGERPTSFLSKYSNVLILIIFIGKGMLGGKDTLIYQICVYNVSCWRNWLSSVDTKKIFNLCNKNSSVKSKLQTVFSSNNDFTGTFSYLSFSISISDWNLFFIKFECILFSIVPYQNFTARLRGISYESINFGHFYCKMTDAPGLNIYSCANTNKYFKRKSCTLMLLFWKCVWRNSEYIKKNYYNISTILK